jgi:hypothetical protein
LKSNRSLTQARFDLERGLVADCFLLLFVDVIRSLVIMFSVLILFFHFILDRGNVHEYSRSSLSFSGSRKLPS